MRTVSPLLAFLFNNITLQYAIVAVANAEHPLFHRQLFRRGTVGVVSQKSVSQRPLIRRGITTDNVDEVAADDTVQRALHDGFDLSLSMPSIASIGSSMSIPMITSDAPTSEAGKYDTETSSPSKSPSLSPVYFDQFDIIPFSFSVSRTNMYISLVA